MIIILLVICVVAAVALGAMINKYLYGYNSLNKLSFLEITTIIKKYAEELIESVETSMVNSTGLEKMNYVVSSIFKIIIKLGYHNITEATIRVIAQQVYDNIKAKRVLSEEVLHSSVDSIKTDHLNKVKSIDHDELVEKIADTVDNVLKQNNITIDRAKIKTAIVNTYETIRLYNPHRNTPRPINVKIDIDESTSSNNSTKISEDHDRISQE